MPCLLLQNITIRAGVPYAPAAVNPVPQCALCHQEFHADGLLPSDLHAERSTCKPSCLSCWAKSFAAAGMQAECVTNVLAHLFVS